MNRSDIETELDFPMGIVAINAFISRMEDEKSEIELLYQISMERKDKVGFHAAWILEKLCEKEPAYALFFIKPLMNDFNRFINKSTIRQYAKLLSNLLKLKNKNRLFEDLNEVLENANPIHIIEACFEQLIDSKTRFSVKQMCCEVLLHYKDKEIWIKEELQAFTEQLAHQTQPSARAFRKRLLKVLY